MSSPGLTPRELFEQNAEEIRKSRTFQTHGVDDGTIERLALIAYKDLGARSANTPTA